MSSLFQPFFISHWLIPSHIEMQQNNLLSKFLTDANGVGPWVRNEFEDFVVAEGNKLILVN